MSVAYKKIAYLLIKNKSIFEHFAKLKMQLAEIQSSSGQVNSKIQLEKLIQIWWQNRSMAKHLLQKDPHGAVSGFGLSRQQRFV